MHTLATQFAGVWCIDLPEELGMTDNSGALALSPAEQTLYVVTGAGKLGVINSADLNSLPCPASPTSASLSARPPTGHGRRERPPLDQYAPRAAHGRPDQPRGAGLAELARA